MASDDDLPADEPWLEQTFGRGAYFPTIWLGTVNIWKGAAYENGKRLCSCATRGEVRSLLKRLNWKKK